MVSLFEKSEREATMEDRYFQAIRPMVDEIHHKILMGAAIDVDERNLLLLSYLYTLIQASELRLDRIEVELAGLRAEFHAFKSENQQERIEFGTEIHRDMAALGADLRREMAELGVALRQEMNALSMELHADINALCSELKAEIARLGENSYSRMDRIAAELRQEIAELRKEFVELRKEFAELRKEFAELRVQFAELRGEFNTLKEHIDAKLEHSSNRTIVLIIGSMGFILGGLQILDRLFPH